MNKNYYFTCTIICIAMLLLYTSCQKESTKPLAQLQVYSGSKQFELQTESIEKIFSSQMPWEARSLNYYNILEDDTVYRMFYNAFDYNQSDFDGSYCIAHSIDGQNWDRPFIKDNTNIVVVGKNNEGVTGPVVFKDDNDAKYPYKMICTKLVKKDECTFLYASANGVDWVMQKQLFNTKQDSQFSIIKKDGNYYVFCRYNDYTNGYQRAVGLFILDGNMNVIQQPVLLLEAGANESFSHIYNSGASKINDSTTLLFPTYFDESTSQVRVKMIYTNNLKDYYLINDDLNDTLFPKKDVNWAIVCPGITPAKEKDTYWLYYLGTISKHGGFNYTTKVDMFYYRIKMVIHQ